MAGIKARETKRVLMRMGFDFILLIYYVINNMANKGKLVLDIPFKTICSMSLCLIFGRLDVRKKTSTE